MTYTGKQVVARSIMKCSTGLPADSIVNDFVFEFTGGTINPPADYPNVVQGVSDFFRHVQAGGHAVGEYISDYVDRAVTHQIDVYTIGTHLGSPVWSAPWLGPVTAAPANALPAECAGVLSFHADLTGVLEVGPTVSDIPTDEDAIDQGAPATHTGQSKPRARRRGRLYVGPLTNVALQSITPPYMLDSTFLQTLREAAGYLASSLGGANWAWSVWSRRDQTTYPVVGGWTDDAPDTQRRRGPKASARVLYTV